MFAVNANEWVFGIKSRNNLHEASYNGYDWTMNTVGSLNADILRYNADNISITLKFWGKLDENVSWVNTFPSH